MDVWVGAIAVAVAALVVALAVRLRQLEVHAFRLKNGWAFVYPSYDDEGEPVRVLRVGGGNQSVTYLGERWNVPFGSYIAKYDYMYGAAIPVREVLMFGGGGYSYPKYALSTNPELCMDVVEYEQKMTDVAMRCFYLDRLVEGCAYEGRGRLNLITAEGRSYLEGCAKKYDAILNDTFVGVKPARALATLEAARAIKAHLNDGGIYISNVIASVEGENSRFIRQTVRSLEEVFAHVHVVRCRPVPASAPSNNLVIASDGDVVLPAAYRMRLSPDTPLLHDS